jgi:hypothetical protein
MVILADIYGIIVKGKARKKIFAISIPNKVGVREWHKNE